MVVDGEQDKSRLVFLFDLKGPNNWFLKDNN